SASTGVGVEGARVVLRRPGSLEPVQGVTDAAGAYYIADLPPGPYTVHAYVDESAIGEQTTTIEHDRITALDFAVGAALDGPIDLNAPSMAPLWRYRPPGADPSTGTIEGTVADTRRERLAGAVISVVRDGEVLAEQTYTDDQGRFHVVGLSPGDYSVSAYYAVLTRAQMEVRRNKVRVDGGEVVVVPLWLETDAW
ncbi:MAG: carboxypeptidase-like regulatory domain-containing protein, partial [Deltaproteobacteria bacterium]|nr:carboxypeptidase-like regulatory domain-containing protein [Kofleriaceae bacterium]